MSSLDFIGLVGATIIFTWSPLFGWARKIWPAFFECALCVGFWVGLGGFFARYLTETAARQGKHEGGPLALDAFLTATATAVLAFATSCVLEWLQTHLKKD